MEPVNLGPTDIKVSPVCIGGMSFGEVFPDFQAWVQDEDTARAVIKRALELGVNFIDTANAYSHGTSEEFIGRSLQNLGVPRDDVVLASKVYFNDGALSAAAIAREIEGTLTRLGTDYLDLYIIHRFDYSTPIEETMEALDSLVKAGKVRALGASEMYGYQLHNMQVAADRLDTIRFHAVPLQPALPRRRAGTTARLPPIRHGDPPLQPTCIRALSTARLGFRLHARENRRVHERQIRFWARTLHGHH